MESLEIPPQWEGLVEKIQDERGTVMVIGASDTGKTTLARFLVRELSRRGEVVSYIDGDMGQSVLGPPTTLGMVRCEGISLHPEKSRPIATYFVGSNSPRGHKLETLVGLGKLLDRSRLDRCTRAVLDTTGYVAGPDALELKYQKMDLLNPRHVVAVQRDKEVEPILKTREKMGTSQIHRLLSSDSVKPRSPEVRRRYRSKRYKDYFEHLRLDRVDLDHASVTGAHRVGIENRPGGWAGLLLGLNGPDNFLLALGILEDLDWNKGILSCLVPSSANLETVCGIRLGSVKMDLSEEVEGEVIPGESEGSI